MTDTPEYDWEAIREARRTGKSYRQLREEFGPSLESLSRHLNGIPAKPKVEPMSTTAYEKMLLDERKEARRRNLIGTNNGDDDGEPDTDEHGAPVLAMPSPGRYPVDGDRPNIGLVKHSHRLLKAYFSAKAQGIVYLRRPPAVSQAWLVVLHDLRPQDRDWFLASRSQWPIIREAAGISLKEMGKRVNTSLSTVRRWENRERTPGASEAAKLQQAYAAAHKEALVKTELALAFDDAYEKIASDEGIDISQVETPLEDTIRWISGDDHEDMTINHLRHLNTARALLPYPQWRTPDAANFCLAGYANKHVSV